MLSLLKQMPYPAVVGSKVNVRAGMISIEVLPQLARPAYVPTIAVNSRVAVQPVLATGVEACIKQQQFLASSIAAGQPGIQSQGTIAAGNALQVSQWLTAPARVGP